MFIIAMNELKHGHSQSFHAASATGAAMPLDICLEAYPLQGTWVTNLRSLVSDYLGARAQHRTEGCGMCAGARQVLLGRLFGSSADAAADLLQDWIRSGVPPWFDEDGLLVLTPPALKVLGTVAEHCHWK